MEQPHVFLDLDSYNNYRIIQQNTEDQIQQQQQHQFQAQGIIMSGNEQSQDVIVQDDQRQTHQVIYSSIKHNEPQYMTQDDSMQSPYIIQSPAAQQVFYANLSPQQNRIQQQQQTVTLNHNIIAQQNQNQPKLVLQSPKVVVQRNNDLMQTNMTQIIDQNQPIQFHFSPSVEQNQAYQIIPPQQAQQIKQTIYPQQSNQVIASQHFLQIPQQNVQQGTTAKVLMQGGNHIQYRYVQKPQQQVQQIAVQSQPGAIMQINQQPQQIQAQGVTRQFRPRLVTAPARFQLRVGSPQQSQQAPGQMLTQRVRTPRPRAKCPTTNPSPVTHQNIQCNPQQKTTPQGSKVYYILQQHPDGSQVLVPHNPQTQPSPHNIVRLVQQKVAPQNQTQQQQMYQVSQSNSSLELQQQPTQSQNQTGEAHAPATSTFTPKKDSDCDDLEDSITATAISKSARSEPPPLTPQSISADDYRKSLGQQNSSRVGVVKPMINTTGNQMRSPTRNPALQVIRQRPVPRQSFQQQQGVSLELEVPERESAKMLVILDNGEQRLITFTLPKETCTVQELLDQVGIKVGADSNIECIENPGSEIDYIVKVGNFASRDTAAMTKAAENHIRQQQQQRQQANPNQRGIILPQGHQTIQPATEIPKSKSPEIKVPPKFVTGFYAVCAACGFSGLDHAKCTRCQRVFTEEPKMQRIPQNQVQKQVNLQSIASPSPSQKIVHTLVPSKNMDKKDQLEALQKKHQIATQRQVAGRGGRGGISTSTPRGRGQRSKTKVVVPEVVTLSSDDESGSDESKSSAARALAEKKVEIYPKKPFEPEIVDDVATGDFIRLNVEEFGEDEQRISTNIACRTVRIGSFKFDSKEKVVVTSKGIKIVAPSVNNPKELHVINIQHSEIVKVVTHFTKQLHIIFIYTKPSCARYISEELQMTQLNDKSPFYSPMSRHEPHKKIVFLADSISDDTKSVLKTVYSRQIMEEINNRDANEMLVRSTGIPLSNSGAPVPTPTSANNTADGSMLQDVDIKKLLIYPPGRGGIAINTNDYVCLSSDVYLNDVIIDFYLKYIHHELLTKEQQDKTHIFSQFFYKRLTTMTKDKDPKLTAAQKRHARVASWTKNVDLFKKDFIIIPINEQSHWFLAIICFPNLMEPHTMDTNQPIKLIPVQKRAKKKAAPVQIGSTTITPLKKEEAILMVTDGDVSERDEAEGDESDLGSNLESEDEEVVDRGQPVKVPCILIFDSLLGAPRSRVVATLRDYLTCEYRVKFPQSPTRQYTKTNLAGNQVKVPQQNNFTDCGLFLLQYVEQFFKDPIKDYRIPIKALMNWFHQDVVTRKREEIAKLIQHLIQRDVPGGIELPEIEFPTKDGVIIEQTEEAKIDNAFDDDEYIPTEDDMKSSPNGSQSVQAKEETKKVYFTKKRSLDKNESSSGESNAKTPKLNFRNKS